MSTAATGIIQPEGFPGLPEGWVYEWETYPSADQSLQLFAGICRKKQVSNTPGKTSQALVIAHGIGEHGGRYFHFPHYLKDSVDLIYFPDHRGHGRSEGPRGHVDQFRTFAEDFKVSIGRAQEVARKHFGRIALHAMGHSMGSLILLQTLESDAHLPLVSACVSSPLLRLKVKAPIVKKLAAFALARVWGSLQMSTEFDARLISHDPAVVDAYRGDRLVHSKITPALFTTMLTAMDEMYPLEKPFDYPLQLIVPMADPICDAEASLEFFHRLKIHDKQLKTYPDFFHESFNEKLGDAEISKDRVFEDFEAWIKNHSVGSSSS